MEKFSFAGTFQNGRVSKMSKTNKTVRRSANF
jgi:hypothetical protein